MHGEYARRGCFVNALVHYPWRVTFCFCVSYILSKFRVLRVVKPKPYMVMQIEVGIPDDKPVAGEAGQWGVEEGTTLEQLEMQVPSVLYFRVLQHKSCSWPCVYWSFSLKFR